MKIFQQTRIRVLGLALLAGSALTIPASADPADVAAITAANIANVAAQVTTTTGITNTLAAMQLSSTLLAAKWASVQSQQTDYANLNNFNNTKNSKLTDVALKGNPTLAVQAYCTPLTTLSGAAAVRLNAEANLAAISGGSIARGSGGGHGGSSGGGTTPDWIAHGGVNPDAYAANKSAPMRVQEVVNTINNNFCNSATDGSTCISPKKPYEDTNIANYFTDSYMNIGPDNGTSAPNIQKLAILTFARHITGEPPENPSMDVNLRNAPSGQTQVAAQRAAIARYNLANLPFHNMVANRETTVPASTSSAPTQAVPAAIISSILAQYQQAGMQPPQVNGQPLSAGSQISRLQLMDALYAQPVENTANATQATAGTPNEVQLLGQMVLETRLLKYMEYQRYNRDEMTQAMLSGMITHGQ